MLKRYALSPMQELWQEETKFKYWFMVELAVLRARVKLGDLKPAAYWAIEKYARFSPARIKKLEKRFRHDMIAFIVSIQESLEKAGFGQYSKEFHKNLTSYDVEDPALILVLREAVGSVINALKSLEAALRKKARAHQWTLMIDRTHGQFAEPSTFGKMLLVFAEAVARSIGRLEAALENELSEGKISGAVGIYAGMNPELERLALKELGLRPAKAETQILQRDRHAALMNALAVAGGSIEQMCRTFWEMMRSDNKELQEPRLKSQRGSSAMAHKRNPILTEQLLGMARLLRAYALAAMENIATPEGRDISQSSVERHIFPDSTYLLYYMALKAVVLVKDLVVFPEKMTANLDKSFGTWASNLVRSALMDAGVSYDAAYRYLQRCSFQAEERGVFLARMLGQEWLSNRDRRTAEEILGAARLIKCFDARAYINRGIEHIFREQK